MSLTGVDAQGQSTEVGSSSSYVNGDSVARNRSFLYIVGVDILCITCAVVIATYFTDIIRSILFDSVPREYMSPYVSGRIWQLTLLIGALVTWMMKNGHYRSRKPLSTESRHILTACIVLFILDGYLQFTMKLQPSRIWLGSTWVLIFAFLIIGRMMSKSVLSRLGKWQVSTLVVGTEASVAEVKDFFSRKNYLGYLVNQQLVVDSDNFEPYADELDTVLRSGTIGNVIFAFDSHTVVFDALSTKVSTQYQVPYGIVPNFRKVSSTDMELQDFLGEDICLLHATRSSTGKYAQGLKRVFDIVVTILLVVVLAIPALVVALAVKLDGGSVFYRSPRVGYNNRVFGALKFRSMVPDAHNELQKLLEADPALKAEWLENFKLCNDPRITKIGAFLRRTSLDELPQLANVLRGEMSLVGPRPMLLEERVQYGASLVNYVHVKPGITGLWQVSGRSDVPYDTRIQLNNWYSRNWSLWGDLSILLKTIGVVASKVGAK